ncbi:nucleoside deaminase [Aestuariirhabdus sp. LZHN29]|uniref:nucleoside deaminase n=1 Tax=Aestuariirhabdus sp. LZHN29 TaxID=3417462 RepID=UPI003CE80628
MFRLSFLKTRPQLELPEIAERLGRLPESDYRSAWARRVCELALQARHEGNYGVGAVLCHGEQILFEAMNAVFEPLHDSSAHAEMRLLDTWEQAVAEGRQSSATLRELTLVCSLEPCPMCLSRLLMSGVRRIYYLAEDPQGGMMTRARHLPPAFRNLMQCCDHGVLRVDEGYRYLARQLSRHGLLQLREKLISY